MSNTAIQRRKKDLLAAGYNPLLAAVGEGASTPSSGMGQISAQDYGGITSSAFQNAATNALSWKQLKMQEKKNNAEVEQIKQMTKNLQNTKEGLIGEGREFIKNVYGEIMKPSFKSKVKDKIQKYGPLINKLFTITGAGGISNMGLNLMSEIIRKNLNSHDLTNNHTSAKHRNYNNSMFDEEDKEIQRLNRWLEEERRK